MKSSLTEDMFEEVKAKFLAAVSKVAHQHHILPQLIINWDQTGLNVVPASTWTMTEEGSTRVPIAGFGDKRQITATVAVSMSGEMLPLQLLYAGKTERCHPSYSFPSGFDIWHIPNRHHHPFHQKHHCSICLQCSRKNGTSSGAPCNSLFDAFRGHRGSVIEDLLKENNLIPVPIPSNCTDRLQPVDVSVNKPLKDHLRKNFTAWYSSQVQQQLEKGTRVEDIKVDLRLSMMKEIEAKWIVSAFDCLEGKSSIIQNGFEEVGIVHAMKTR